MWWPLTDSGRGSAPSAQSSKIREIFIQVILTIFKMMSSERWTYSVSHWACIHARRIAGFRTRSKVSGKSVNAVIG